MKNIAKFLNLLTAVLIVFVSGVCPANAAFRTVGPPSAVHGFPLWYQDVTGLTLQPCLDQTSLSPAGGLLCLLPGPDAADPLGFDPTVNPAAHPITTTGPINDTNFPIESFYWVADASADIIVPGGAPAATPARFKLRMAQEASFAGAVGTGPLTFLRVNIQKIPGGLVPGGTYTVSIPFGADITFTANLDGSAGGVGGTFAGQTFRNQIDALPPLFDTILPGIFPAVPPQQPLSFTMDNFLVWDPAVLPAAPAGFIGDPQVPHRVVKAGDTVQAVVTFSGTGLAAPVTITDFSLAGKIIGLVITPPAGGTDFGVTKLSPVTATKTFTVSNLSPNIVNVVVASDNVIDYAILNNTCGQLLPGTPPSTCTFDVAFSPATNGLKTAVITVSDQGAAVPATTVNLAGTGDGVLPSVTITSPANNGFTNDATPLLSFTVTDANPVTNAVKVDGLVVAKVSGDSLAQLADAQHTVLVESTDGAGNLGSATSTFTVDTVAPVVAISSPAPGLTKNSTPLLTFTATDANPVTNVVKVDGALVAKVSGDTLAQLADGPHTVRVDTTDAAGNTSFAEVTITVDATAPVVNLTAPANNGFSKIGTPLLTFSVTDASAVTNVVKVDGLVVAKVSGDSLAQLADGQHTVLVESTDGAGNLGSATSTFMVDTVAPVVAIASPAAGLTKNSTPLLSFSVTDATAVTNVVKVDGVVVAKLSGDTLAQLANGQHTVRVESTDAAGNTSFAEVTITVDSAAPFISLTAPANNSFSKTGTPLLTFSVTDTDTVTNVVKVDNVVVNKVSGDTLAQLADGQHTVLVESTDVAGNSSSATVTFTVDTALPVVAIASPVAGPTKNSTLLLTFSVTDATALTNVVKVDGVVVAKLSGDTLAQLANGQHTVRVESTDAAGNTSFAEVVVTVDTAPPVVSLTSPANNGFSKTGTPLLTFSVTDGTTVTNVVKVDGVVVAKLSGDTLAKLADGQHTVRVDATDAAGNSSFATVSFTVDTAPPVVAIASPVAGLTKNSTPLLSFSVTDATAVTNVVKVDGVVVAKVSGNSLAQLADGQHTVRVEASDAAGNTSFAEVLITVDTTPPVLTLSGFTTPTKVATQTISGTVEAGAIVKVALGNGAPADATVSGASWSFNVAALAQGTNSFTVTATDPAGNSSSVKQSIIYDPLNPSLAVTNPVNDVTIHEGKITISGTADGTISGIGDLVIKADGKEYHPAVTNGTFSQEVTFSSEKLYPVTVTVTDQAGNSESVTRNVNFLKGTIVINGGALFTVTPKVTLTLSYFPSAAKMQFLLNDKTWTKAAPFAVTKFVSLPGGNGLKTVKVRYLDQNGTILGEYAAAITLDTKVPSGTVVINNKALYTNSKSVVLTITALDVTSGLNGICVKESKIPCTQDEFGPFVTTKNFEITTPDDGKKVIYVTLKDSAGITSKPIKASIILDTKAPTGSIVINGGKATTTSPLVTLRLKADKAAEMQLSLDGGTTWGPWEKFVASKKVTLPTGAGSKSVKVKYRDLAGNESGEFEDSIILQ